MAGDGRVESFTAESFAGVRNVLRLVSLGLLLISAALAIWRRNATRVLWWLASRSASFCAEVANEVRGTLAASGRRHLVLLVVLTLLGAAMRLVFLGQPIRYDEAFTFLEYVDQPFAVTLSDYSTPNNHILHSVLAKISTFLFGDQLWTLRLPALLAGILVPPATYAVVRAYYNSRAALVAAALTAVSSPLVLYSTNARGYSIVTLFFLCLLLVVWHQSARPRPGAWIAFALFGAFGVFAIPVMLYPLGIAAAWFLMSSILEAEAPWQRIRELSTAILTVGILTLILYAPALLWSGPSALVANRWVSSQPLDVYLAGLPSLVSRIWETWNVDHALPLRAALAAGIVVTVVCHRRLSRLRVPLWAPAVLWTVALSVANRGVTGQMFVRVWIFALPLYLGLAAVGLEAIVDWGGRRLTSGTWRRGPASEVLAVGLAAWIGFTLLMSRSVEASRETGTMIDAADVSVYLDEILASRDRVIAMAPGLGPVRYHLSRLGRSPEVVVSLRGLEPAHLPDDLSIAPRLFVIVNDDWETDEDVFDAVRQTLGIGTDRAKILKKFRAARLYQIQGVERQ